MTGRHTVSGLMYWESWEVSIPADIADSRIVVPANMSPDNQIQMLDQCHAEEKFVIADNDGPVD